MEDFDDNAGRGTTMERRVAWREDAGFEIELAEDGFADVAELGVSRAAMRVSVLSFRQGTHRLQLPQLVIDAAEVVEQAADIVEVGIVGMGSRQNG